MLHYIPQTLEVLTKSEERREADWQETSFDTHRGKQGLILIGAPGAGKTRYLQKLAQEGEGDFITASKVLRGRIASVGKDSRILIDGFDECRSQKVDAKKGSLGELADVIYQRLPAPFLISCREADWHHFIDTNGLKEELELNESIPVLRLRPFSDDQCLAFMKAYGITDYEKAFIEAEKFDIHDLLRNPQTLLMLCDTYRKNGAWPHNKLSLYEQACQFMATEKGERRKEAMPLSKILGLAGGLFATMLLSAKDSICIEASLIGETTLYAPDVDENADWQSVLDSRLFASLDGDSFGPAHRTVAEFLGAQHLARKCKEGVSPARIVSLLSNGLGIPTALRGLAGWLCTLSEGLARVIIALDPLAIVHNGDISALPSETKLQYFITLCLNSERETGIAFEQIEWLQWERFRGLWAIGLSDAIKEALSKTEAHYAIHRIALQAVMGGGTQSNHLTPDLLSFIRNNQVSSYARSQALLAIDLINPNSASLILEILSELHEGSVSDEDHELRGAAFRLLYPSHLPPRQVGKYLVTESEHFTGRYSLFIRRELLDRTPKNQFRDLLESVIENNVAFGKRHYSSHEEIIWQIFLSALKAESKALKVDTLWKWLGIIHDEHGLVAPPRNSNYLEQLSAWMKGHGELVDQLWTRRFEIREECKFEHDQLFRMGVIPIARDKTLTVLTKSIQDTIQSHGNSIKLRDFVALFTNCIFQEPITDFRVGLIKLIQNTDAAFEYLNSMGAQDISHHIQLKQQEIVYEETRNSRLSNLKNKINSHKHELADKAHIPILSKTAQCYLQGFTENTSETADGRLDELCGSELSTVVKQRFVDVLLHNSLPAVEEFITLLQSNQMPWETRPVLAALRVITSESLPLPSPLSTDSIAFATCSWAACGFHDDNESIELLIKLAPRTVKETLILFWKNILETDPSRGFNLYNLNTNASFSRIANEIATPIWKTLQNIIWEHEKYLLSAILKYGDISLLSDEFANRLYNATWPISRSNHLSYLIFLFIEHPDLWGNTFESYFSRPQLFYAVNEWFHRDFPKQFELSHSQRELIIQTLALHARNPERHAGYVTNADTARETILSQLQTIAASTEIEASKTLLRLYENERLSTWNDFIARHIRVQTMQMCDASLAFSTPEAIRLSLIGGPPANHADFLVVVEETLLEVGREIQTGKNDADDSFWTMETDPRRRRSSKKEPESRLVPWDEEKARDRLTILLEPRLKGYGIHREPHNKDSKRTDILFTFNGMEIPLEAKGQWNAGSTSSHGVWDGIESQLIPLYSSSPQAKGYGIFLVFWFGAVKGKELASPPSSLEINTPATPEELQNALVKTVPSGYENSIRVVVLNCSRQNKKT